MIERTKRSLDKTYNLKTFALTLSDILQSGATQSTLLGDFTATTAAILSSDTTLWDQYLSCLTVNPGLLAESLNTDFLVPLRERGEVVIRTLLEECNKEKWEEHVKLTIRQVGPVVPV